MRLGPWPGGYKPSRLDMYETEEGVMRRIAAVFMVMIILLVVAGACDQEQPQPTASPLDAQAAEAPDAEIPPIPDAVELSGEGISAIVAMIISLALVYVPGLNDTWRTLSHKREMLGGIGLIVAASLVGLHYAGAVDLGLAAFGWPVVWKALRAWLVFAGSAQISYTVQRA